MRGHRDTVLLIGVAAILLCRPHVCVLFGFVVAPERGADVYEFHFLRLLFCPLS